MKNIKTSLWLLPVAFFAVSCTQKEGAVYENPENKIFVSLASAKYAAELTPDDGNQITVQVNRNSATGAFDAPFSFKSSSTLFSMADTVAHFADGKAITHLTISHQGSEKMVSGNTDTLTVKLADTDMLSVGGISTQTLTISRRQE
ncbi:MAG: hypothetical protein LBG92_01825 [Prevotellaceae bacterium]|jgi:hypothetical protein|nr:hypothetical protein [Prevotellaceae bacterium]